MGQVKTQANQPLDTNLPRMNAEEVKRRMKQTIDKYIDSRPPVVADGQFRYYREIAEIKRRQREFYATLAYYESMMVATTPVLPLPVTESTTTLVAYTPLPRQRRGRPSTGGRRPRDRRKQQDSEYTPY